MPVRDSRALEELPLVRWRRYEDGTYTVEVAVKPVRGEGGRYDHLEMVRKAVEVPSEEAETVISFTLTSEQRGKIHEALGLKEAG